MRKPQMDDKMKIWEILLWCFICMLYTGKKSRAGPGMYILCPGHGPGTDTQGPEYAFMHDGLRGNTLLSNNMIWASFGIDRQGSGRAWTGIGGLRLGWAGSPGPAPENFCCLWFLDLPKYVFEYWLYLCLARIFFSQSFMARLFFSLIFRVKLFFS